MKSAVAVAKKTSKNQLTLPKAIVKQFPGVEYFKVRADAGRIVLEPFVQSRADDVREKLSQLGISEDDVADAIAWARSR